MLLEDPARGHCYYGEFFELHNLLEICFCYHVWKEEQLGAEHGPADIIYMDFSGSYDL